MTDVREEFVCGECGKVFATVRECSTHQFNANHPVGVGA